jgi:type IV pilus assembly protein PilQ
LLLGLVAFSAVSAPVLFGLTAPVAVIAAEAEVKTNATTPAAKQVGKIELLPGKRVKLKYQDVEVRSLLKALAEAAGVNMLVSDKITGSVTVKLAEMPWDQALNTILGSQGLVKREQDGILFIEPATAIVGPTPAAS